MTSSNSEGPPDLKPACVPYTSSRISMSRPAKMDIDAITNDPHDSEGVSDAAGGSGDAKAADFAEKKDFFKSGEKREASPVMSEKRQLSPPTPEKHLEPPLTPPSKRASLSLKRSSAQFLSPEKRSSQFLSPEKRSSAQFLSPSYNQSYNVPASPGVFSSKRTSGGVFKYNFPQTPDRFSRSNIPSTVSPSAALASPRHYTSTDEILRSSEKLQEISSNLKTRLSYAFLKVQNGWQDKSLAELEHPDDVEEMDTDRPSKRRPSIVLRNKHQSLPASLPQSSNFLNQLIDSSALTTNPKQGLMEPFNTTPNRKATTRPRGIYIANPTLSIPSYNFEEEDHILSANDAFLAAISRSSPKKTSQGAGQPKKNLQKSTSIPNYNRLPAHGHVPQRSLTFSPIKTDLKPPTQDEDKSKEQEAIQSLLSLSSPISKTNSQKPWANVTTSPTPNKHTSSHQQRPRNRLSADDSRRLSVEMDKQDSSSTEEEMDDEMSSASPVQAKTPSAAEYAKSRSSTPLSQIKSTAAAL